MKKLIVVESPTKAKTIGKFLGSDYSIIATMGHIRDLPSKRFAIKITEKKEIHFEPQYKIIPNKREVVDKLKNNIKKADKVILATDPDREGEAIAHHVYVVGSSSKFKVQNSKFSRIVFHEITEKAVEEALKNPHGLNQDLVNAQQARRMLDRIVGYKLSPLLWRKVRRGLSAGRVQSVAVRLIVEREREIKNFSQKDYCRAWVLFRTQKGGEFLAELIKIKDNKVETKEKFDLFAGNYQVVQTILESEKEAEKIILDLLGKPKIERIEEKEKSYYPSPPFTTSTLQQTASRKFGWSSRLTMQVAQGLYERGLISYHRTDSTSLNQDFVSKARNYVKEKYGQKYLPSKAIFYKTKTRLAQEAHEAIRPVNSQKEKLIKANHREQSLYRLIWQRSIACQMSPAKIAATKVIVQDGSLEFQANGTRLVFSGFSKAYPMVFSENNLPELKEKEALDYIHLGITSHQTQSPPRYNEASLIRTLEKEGIGRPSTYAPIISLIQKRSYVEKEEKVFLPTNLGIAVNDFLVSNFPKILNLPFTAGLENDLDEVAKGKKEWMRVLANFWQPFIKKVELSKEKAERVKIEVEELDEKCPQCKKGNLIIRIGPYGKFIACSAFPECKYKRSFVVEAGFVCPECDSSAVLKRTKRGKTFYGCSNYPSCKWASWKKPKKE
ncbi:MAG: type I DNA topoisomerase [Candidatus Shapirobacteria bacterium]